MAERQTAHDSIRHPDCGEVGKIAVLAAVWNRIESQWKSRKRGYVMSSNKVSIKSHPIPEAVKFYADLCVESDDYSPVAVHCVTSAKMGIEMGHFWWRVWDVEI
jgi:hypothetical protein